MSMSRLLFSLQGWLNRQPYWLASIVIIVLMLLLIVLEFGWIALAMVGEREFWASDATLAIIVILDLPLLFVALALTAKRLHDRDKFRLVATAVLCCAVDSVVGRRPHGEVLDIDAGGRRPLKPPP
jgi:uncharacterized membrane protein YhaH (DUF805 family)